MIQMMHGLASVTKDLEFILRQWKVSVQVAQLCPTLCDPMDCSLPVSSVHGISQTRILEWVAISFSIFRLTSCFVVKLVFRPEKV